MSSAEATKPDNRCRRDSQPRRSLFRGFLKRRNKLKTNKETTQNFVEAAASANTVSADAKLNSAKESARTSVRGACNDRSDTPWLDAL